MKILGGLRAPLFRLLHDLVAHPLIGVTNSAKWAEDFHDWVGEVASIPPSARGIRLRGPEVEVARALDDLERAGWHVYGAHTHPSGDGCGGVSRPGSSDPPRRRLPYSRPTARSHHRIPPKGEVDQLLAALEDAQRRILELEAQGVEARAWLAGLFEEDP